MSSRALGIGAPPHPYRAHIDARGAFLFTGLLGAAVALGALSAVKPSVAIALLALGLLVVAAVRAPVAYLLALIFVTGLVPMAILSRYGTGGSPNAAGVLPTDPMLLIGLARAAWVLRREPLDRRGCIALTLTLLFLGAAVLQLVHAVELGRSVSGVGSELRTLLGFGTVLMAYPLLSDATTRRRLLVGLVGFGVLLGVWGVSQFVLGIRFDAPAELGGSSVATFTTAGRVVGMFCFPVAALVALAVLVSGQLRSSAVRMVLLAVVLLNLAALVLTFERSFFVATVVGVIVILVRGQGHQRLRLLVWAPVGFLTVFLALGALAPSVLSAYGTRLSTLADYQTDPSVTYRVAESRMVSSQIAKHPLTGSGLGAAIIIGRPGTNVPLAPRRYAENGYLWLAWKLGWPAAGVLWLLMGLAIAWPRRRGEEQLFAATRLGAQAALVALVVVTASFASFTQLAITPVMGLLIALCAAPVVRAEGVRAAAGAAEDQR
jgi:O-Antigen ligase